MGIFAVGQVARGFIAIGQLAVGVVALGQGCVSIWGVGQGGIGVGYFAGMLGFGGRGICIRLIPGLDLPRERIATQAIDAVRTPGSDATIDVEIAKSDRGTWLSHRGQLLPAKITPMVRTGIASAEEGCVKKLWAHLRNENGTLVCDRLVEVPGQRRSYSIGFDVFRAISLVAVATVWWWAFSSKF